LCAVVRRSQELHQLDGAGGRGLGQYRGDRRIPHLRVEVGEERDRLPAHLLGRRRAQRREKVRPGPGEADVVGHEPHNGDPPIVTQLVQQPGRYLPGALGEAVDHSGQVHDPSGRIGEDLEEEDGRDVRGVDPLLQEERAQAPGVPAGPVVAGQLADGVAPVIRRNDGGHRVHDQRVEPVGNRLGGARRPIGVGAAGPVQEPAQARPLRRTQHPVAVQGVAQGEDGPHGPAPPVVEGDSGGLEPSEQRVVEVVIDRARHLQTVVHHAAVARELAEHLRVGAVDDVVDRAGVQGPVHRLERQQRPVDQVAD